MLIPIGDDQVKNGYFPFFSYGLIIINILIFLYQFSLSPNDCHLFNLSFGVIPVEIVNGENYYSLLTNMFLHGGWMHLVGNMLFLWVFADNIEATIGNIPFIVFYILGGVAASLVHIAFNMNSPIPAIGASGAIAAVMGAYLVMFYKNRIKVLFFFIKSFHINAFIFLGIYLVQQLISGIGALDPQVAAASGTAWWAHIGGIFFGIIMGFVWWKFWPRRKDNFDMV